LKIDDWANPARAGLVYATVRIINKFIYFQVRGCS